MEDKALKDIFGERPKDTSYEKWLVENARRFVREDINHKTAEWLYNVTLANKYTGRIQVTRQDIFEWVNEMDKCTEIISALCNLRNEE